MDTCHTCTDTRKAAKSTTVLLSNSLFCAFFWPSPASIACTIMYYAVAMLFPCMAPVSVSIRVQMLCIPEAPCMSRMLQNAVPRMGIMQRSWAKAKDHPRKRSATVYRQKTVQCAKKVRTTRCIPPLVFFGAARQSSPDPKAILQSGRRPRHITTNHNASCERPKDCPCSPLFTPFWLALWKHVTSEPIHFKQPV